MTQEGLARKIGISVSVLGEIERGSRLPTEDFLDKVAEILVVPRGELEPSDDN
ncbi:putative transcriptional regulator [Bacillus sp. SG-1]|nr:putative transcriptional regulator [Bacillus sp. SG-1]